LQKQKLLKAIDRFIEAVQRTRKYKTLAPIENKLQKEMQKAFRKQGELFLVEFEKFKNRFQESVRPEDTDPAFDRVFLATSIAMEEAIKSGQTKALKKAGVRFMADLKTGISFDLKNPRAVDYLEKNAAEKITMINETTREQIKRIITKGVEEGWSYNKMAEEIINRFEEFAVGQPQHHIESRAHLVAVTETAEAYEEGSRIAAQQIQAQGLLMQKSWLTVGDKRVSDGCYENQRKGWIDLEDSFPSGHQRPPRFPGCRCTVLYRRKPRERGERKK